MKKQVKPEPEWHLFDAKGEILGRLAVRIANALRGKDKPTFSPAKDCGDFAVVINAREIQVTGKKLTQKVYYRHSGYPGGLKAETLKEKLSKKPEEVIKKAVWGMLPANKLRKIWMKRLYVFSEAKHPFEDKVRKNA
jgi:large subunit ribosomal protein L13